MGPRPNRPRLPAPAGAPRPAPVVVTTGRQVAPVGAPSPRRTPTAPTVPLPADLRAALSTIAKTLRNVPREAIHDPPELFVWLNRQAKALERARDMPMPASQGLARPSSPKSTLPAPPRSLSARERAEAVFSGVTVPTSGVVQLDASPPTSAEAMFRSSVGILSRPQIVMDRKGRGVRVEVRRAREAGQMEMPL